MFDNTTVENAGERIAEINKIKGSIFKHGKGLGYSENEKERKQSFSNKNDEGIEIHAS